MQSENQTKEHFVVLDGYVPVIDLTRARGGDPGDRQAVAATIDETCRDSGFLVVTGHGIDPDLIERMHDASLAFFLLPEEIKDQYLAEPGDPTIRGLYKTASYVAASDDTPTAPDLCQLYTVCRLGEPEVATHKTLGDDYDVWSKPNPWPTEIDTFKSVWLDVPVVPGSFVVNIGDLMSVWTNDQWQSTKHRVRVPPVDRRTTPRVSIPFFHQPNWDAEIACLPSCQPADGPPAHDTVTSGAYLLRKINAAYN